MSLTLDPTEEFRRRKLRRAHRWLPEEFDHGRGFRWVRHRRSREAKLTSSSHLEYRILQRFEDLL